MKLKKVQTIMIYLSALCVLGLLPLYAFESDIMKIIGLVVLFASIIASIVVYFIFWRCPSCRSLLPIGYGMVNLQYCPACGKKLKYR